MALKKQKNHPKILNLLTEQQILFPDLFWITTLWSDGLLTSIKFEFLAELEGSS